MEQAQMVMPRVSGQGVSLRKASDGELPAGMIMVPSEYALDGRRGGEFPFAWLMDRNDLDSFADWLRLAPR